MHRTVNHQVMPLRWLRSIDGCFHRFVCVLEPEKHVRNKIIHGLPWIMSFWLLVRSLVTASLMKIIGESLYSWKKSLLFMATHISFYILIGVMALCHPDSWPNSMMLYGNTRPQWVNHTWYKRRLTPSGPAWHFILNFHWPQCKSTGPEHGASGLSCRLHEYSTWYYQEVGNTLQTSVEKAEI